MSSGEKSFLGKSFLERNICGKWQKPVIYLLPSRWKIHPCSLCRSYSKHSSMHIKVWRVRFRGEATRKNYSKIYDHKKAESHRSKKAPTYPFSWRHRIYSGVSGHKVYNAENWSTDSSEEKLSVLKMKIYTRPFSSNVATFVSFDMETLFYDDGRSIKLERKHPVGDSPHVLSVTA